MRECSPQSRRYRRLLREQGGEALVALAQAALHAAGHEGVTPLERVDERGGLEPGPAVAEIDQAQGLERDRVGEALVGECLDDAVGPHLVEAAVEGELLAAAVDVEVAVGA